MKKACSGLLGPSACFAGLFTLVATAMALTPGRARAASQSIAITNLPAFGSTGSLAGLALGADPATNSVAVFIYVPHVSPQPGVARPASWGWFSRPSCAAPLTPIQPDGSWSANITSSNYDVYATEVAAFLVPSNYDQACIIAQPGFPAALLSQASASVYTPRVNPYRRQIEFAGYGWWAKTAGDADGQVQDEFPYPTGPGRPNGNYFTDSTTNLWVDPQGALHLKISQAYGVWQCAEIFSDRSFGYGQYRFNVATDLDRLDPNVCLGLFTWSDDASYNNREIDIEISRWDYAHGASNVEDFAVAPYNSGQTVYFPAPAGVTNSTHSFIWQSNSVAFQALSGVYTSSPPPASVINTFDNCPQPLPPPGGEQVSIVLWLVYATNPVSSQAVEVVIPSFQFVPLGTPEPARLGPLARPTNTNVLLTLQGQMDRRYDLFYSSNLANWLPADSILATNSTFQFSDTNSLPAATRFYRARTEP